MDSISALLLIEVEVALARFDNLVEKDLFLFHQIVLIFSIHQDLS